MGKEKIFLCKLLIPKKVSTFTLGGEDIDIW